MKYRALTPILRNGEFFPAGKEIELAADAAVTLPVEPIEAQEEKPKPTAPKPKPSKPTVPRGKPKKAGGK